MKLYRLMALTFGLFMVVAMWGTGCEREAGWTVGEEPALEAPEGEVGVVEPGVEEAAFAITEVKLMLPNDDEVALDSKRISRYSKIKILYEGERDADPVVTLDGNPVEYTIISDEDGVLLIKPNMPLHNLKTYAIADYTFKVRAPGDVNGDGLSDFVVGAPLYDDGANRGAAFVFFGKTDLNYESYADADVRIVGDSVDARLGDAVALGDLNGDGYSDIAVGAPMALEAGVPHGSVIVIYGGESMQNLYAVGANQFDFYVHRTNGPMSDLGSALAFGDANGDGIQDLLIGEHTADTADNTPGVHKFNAGALHAIYGKKEKLGQGILFDGGQPEGTASFSLVYSNQQVGRSVAAADMNGDGVDDIIIGAPHITNQGRVFIVLGSSELQSHSLSYDTVLTAPSATVEHFGVSVALRGDLNNDRKEEIIIGAKQHIYVYDIDDPTPSNLVIQYGFAGDIEVGGIKVGDLIGDPDADLFIKYRYMVGDQIEHSDAPGRRLGCAVSAAGDLNGDGVGDYLVGEAYRPTTGSLKDRGFAHVNMEDPIPGYINTNLNKGSRFGTALAGGNIR